MWRTAAAGQDMRKHTVKPRLSDHGMLQLHNMFKDTDLASVNAQAFIGCDFGSYARQIQAIARGRRAFLTSNGRLAIGPSEVQIGDELVVILGADVPFIVRRLSHDTFILVGEAYVDGYMDGEALMEANAVQISVE